MSYLTLSNLDKSFGASHVVKNFSLAIEKGEFVSFLGPSGCGKTTVLRMVAGFEQPDAGHIMIDGQDVTLARANTRNIGMVFQAYALFPNLTVADNVGFGLRIKGMARAAITQRVAEMLRLIGLPELASRYPYQLSGGQQQRVALARALAPSPRVLLLDEPLSALDAKIRVSLRAEIRDIQRKLGITTIFVTHDQEEALSISDRVVVMNGGITEQAGTAFDIYNRPATRFVAGFVGTLNVMDGVVQDGKVQLGHAVVKHEAVAGLANGTSVTLGLRPEALRLGVGARSMVNLQGTVQSTAFMGSVLRIALDVAGAVVTVDSFSRASETAPEVGSNLPFHFSPGDAFVLTTPDTRQSLST